MIGVKIWSSEYSGKIAVISCENIAALFCQYSIKSHGAIYFVILKLAMSYIFS
jgi:hypothetical protein